MRIFKTLTLLLFCNVFVVQNINSQILYGNISINSQEEANAIDSILGDFDVLDGSLFIGSGSQQFKTDIVDISQLLPLRKVTGGITIMNNGRLKNLHGLENLDSLMTHSLRIEQNDSLMNVDALANLEYIADGDWFGFFYIEYNPLLESINAFHNLERIPCDLHIVGNDALGNIAGFSNLKFVEGSFFILKNESLLSLSGFSALDTMNYNFYVAENNSLTDLIPNGNVELIKRGIIIDDCPNLENLAGIHSARMHEISHPTTGALTKGVFRIRNCDQLMDLGEFPNIDSIQEIEIRDNENLLSVNAFPNLVYRGLASEIENNASLQFIDFPALNYSGSAFIVKNNPSLLDIGALPALTYQGYYIEIAYNNKLQNVEAFENLETCFSVEIRGDSLSNIIGFNNVEEMNGWFNPEIRISGGEHVEVFNKVKNIQGEVIIAALSQTLNHNSFNQLDTINRLEVLYYHSDADFNSFQNLTVIDSLRGLSHHNNNNYFPHLVMFMRDSMPRIDMSHWFPSLRKIDSYPRYSHSAGDICSISLRQNEALRTPLFPALDTVMSSVLIRKYSNNPIGGTLQHIKGFNNLKYVGQTFEVFGNPELESWTGLNKIEYIGEHVALQHNSNITNANALCHIIENDANQGEFYLNDNNTGFNNLEDIQLHCDTVTLTKEMSVPAQLLTIHPNPSSTDLYIEMDESVVFPARLQIVDRLGRIVRQETIESNAVSLPVYDLANGVYSLFLKSRDGEMRHTKFVKQR